MIRNKSYLDIVTQVEFVNMSTIAEENFKKQLETIKKEYEVAGKDTDNHFKRVMYSKIELLRLDIEESSNIDVEFKNRTFEELNSISQQLNLRPAQRSTNFIMKIDKILRILSSWTSLVTAATLLTIPMIILKEIDGYLVDKKIITPTEQLAEKVKRFIGKIILMTSGVCLRVEMEDPNCYGNSLVMSCFSHTSTLDAFIISSTLPVRHSFLAKKELFLIPFFSWLMVPFGGIPIDREKRENAIRSLKIASESAKVGESIMIAPEGTRSTSGQLFPFKKGPFHMWDHLKCPVIPVVLFGAFELYPPGNF
jgi:1-acyl-sn-glycerol-3-phosphate acyltransferase